MLSGWILPEASDARTRSSCSPGVVSHSKAKRSQARGIFGPRRSAGRHSPPSILYPTDAIVSAPDQARPVISTDPLHARHRCPAGHYEANRVRVVRRQRLPVHEVRQNDVLLQRLAKWQRTGETGLVEALRHHLGRRCFEPGLLQQQPQRYTRPLRNPDCPEPPRRPLRLPYLLLPKEDAPVPGAFECPRHRDRRQRQKVLVAQRKAARDAQSLDTQSLRRYTYA